MRVFSVMIFLAVFTTLCASPTTTLVPRCSTTVHPSFTQQLCSTLPNIVIPTTAIFLVSLDISSNGQITEQISQLVAFRNISESAYSCQLNLVFPPSSALVSWGFPILNVYSLHRFDFGDGVLQPINWSWNDLYPKIEYSDVFGEVLSVPGENVVINAEVCAADLAFLFEVAGWVGVTSGVEFEVGEAIGVFLSYDC